MNSVKNLQDTNFSQLTVIEESEIRNCGREIPDLVISQSFSSIKQAHVRKFNPVTYAKQKRLSGCAEIITVKPF